MTIADKGDALVIQTEKGEAVLDVQAVYGKRIIYEPVYNNDLQLANYHMDDLQSDHITVHSDADPMELAHQLQRGQQLHS